MRLDNILGLPRSGVVVIKRGDSVLVSYTTNMASELQQIYNQFQGKSDIELFVFSSGSDLETLKIHTEYYREYYKELGYRSFQDYGRRAIQYRVRVIPSHDFKYMDVELVSARGDGCGVVGRFDSKPEALDFIETYYRADNPFRLPVYAVNQYTKDLILSQAKLLSIK